MTGSEEILDNRPREKFLCGVVEGFYGIPWTSEQRKLLFQWMETMGMTTYMYGPKDDAKHRAFWRDLYSVEEADNLTSLIEAAADSNINFVYAISPGLDISFSSSKDVQFLKRKLEQVAEFGCSAFALLFDDIDPELSILDKGMFQSSACAQVSITNEVYEHLGQPEFYFCPTEYCTTRAVPSLEASDYLKTVGSKLLSDINVLWTGSKVISKKITVSELEEVSQVLKRPVVIWDNIHANDYDPKRVFLGPYDGRSPEIIPYIRGVLSNPNCEFEANYVPLHTLGQWSKSNVDGVKKDIIAESRLSPVASDIRLENESDYGSDDDIPFLDRRYQPKHALKTAIGDWLLEFRKTRHAPKSLAVATRLPEPVLVHSESVQTCATTVCPVTCVNALSYIQPTSTVLVNSLVDPVTSTSAQHKLPDHEISHETSHSSVDMEPMDCVLSTSALDDTCNVTTHIDAVGSNALSDNLMQVEVDSSHNTSDTECAMLQLDALVNTDSALLTVDDVDFLISMFYLPFDYGSRPLIMLQDLHWLKSNAKLVTVSKCNASPCSLLEQSSEVHEWWERSNRFLASVEHVERINRILKAIPNQAIHYYFFPYVWDVLGVLQTCGTYVKWLGLGFVMPPCHVPGDLTWMSKEYRDSYTSGDLEPWWYQGGLQAELQRMLPIAAAHDLFRLRYPEKMFKKSYTYRPYKPSDEAMVYDICLKTCDDGMDGTEVFPENPELIGDKLVGGMVTLCPEFSFVIEDEDGIMGYVAAAPDAKVLRQKQQLAWVQAMSEKYPKPERIDELTPAEELMMGFHGEASEIPLPVLVSFPSALRLDVLPARMEDLTIPKRLLACALSALKSAGSTGVYVELSVGDKCMTEHYRYLGFIQVPDIATDDSIYLGRLL